MLPSSSAVIIPQIHWFLDVSEAHISTAYHFMFLQTPEFLSNDPKKWSEKISPLQLFYNQKKTFKTQNMSMSQCPASLAGLASPQRLQWLRWGKFTLPHGHSQLPFSPPVVSNLMGYQATYGVTSKLCTASTKMTPSWIVRKIIQSR